MVAALILLTEMMLIKSNCAGYMYAYIHYPCLYAPDAIFFFFKYSLKGIATSLLELFTSFPWWMMITSADVSIFWSCSIIQLVLDSPLSHAFKKKKKTLHLSVHVLFFFLCYLFWLFIPDRQPNLHTKNPIIYVLKFRLMDF